MNFPTGLTPVRDLYRIIVVLLLNGCIGLFAQTAYCAATEGDSLAVNSRFQRTVQVLQESTGEMQAVFATAALNELAEVYMAEADLARKQTGPAAQSPKVMRWARAVDQYANQLSLVLADIELGLPVELHERAEQAVSVTVGGRSVILSHPRADQQSAFEQRVLLDFCATENCKQLTARIEAAQPIPVTATQVRPQWTFTESGPVCSHEGIRVRFGSDRHLGRYRATCEQLLQEAYALATEIAWQQRHAVAVDWDKLIISATPGRPEHVVRLNKAGDSILITLPLIYASPNLLAHIKPWLQSRFSSTKSAVIELDARQYGWEGKAGLQRD